MALWRDRESVKQEDSSRLDADVISSQVPAISELTQQPAASGAEIANQASPNAARGFWFAILATISWAVASVLTKATTGKLPPQMLFATELATGAFALWVWVLATDPFRLKLRTACKLALPGLLQPGLAFSLTFVALQWTTISNETLIWSTESVLMLVLASIFLGQPLSRRLILFSLLAFLGVALMSLAGRRDPVFGSRIGVADFMIVLGVMAACAYSFLAERALAHLREEQLFALHQTAGLLIAGAFAAIEWKLHGGPTLAAPASVWLIACLAGVLLFALPFVLYLRAIRALGASASAQFLPLVPIMTAALAAVFLRERLNLLQCLGIVIVIGAVTRIGFLQREHGRR